MALKIYDADQNPIVDTQHAYVDGVSGGVYEFKVFVQNSDSAKYYTGVTLKYLVDGLADWYDPAVSRVTVRMYAPADPDQPGSQPSGTDWKNIAPGDSLVIGTGAIGSSAAGNTLFYPVWIRVFVPGNTEASTLRHGLKLVATELVVL